MVFWDALKSTAGRIFMGRQMNGAAFQAAFQAAVTERERQRDRLTMLVTSFANG